MNSISPTLPFTIRWTVLEGLGEQTTTLGGAQVQLPGDGNLSSPINLLTQDCSGCDVHSHLYSFSFNLNPNWSKQLAEQKEILQYIEDTVDKFQLRPHINTSIECLGASWNNSEAQWHVTLKDLATDIIFTRKATMFISAVGGISMPREVRTMRLTQL